jgi:hypothetical protein
VREGNDERGGKHWDILVEAERAGARAEGGGLGGVVVRPRGRSRPLAAGRRRHWFVECAFEP